MDETMRFAPILTLILVVANILFAQDGEHIIRVGSGGISGNYCDVKAYNENIAYYTNRFGLVVMDVSDPENPNPARIIPTRGNAQGLFLKDSLLFLCDGYEGLRIYDLNDDPWNPRVISHTTGPSNARGLVVIDDFAYLWQYRNSVGFIYDVSDPEQPEELSRTNFRGGESMQIHPFGDRCYIVSANAPTSYWDISDRTNPEMIGVVNGTLRSGEHNTLFDDRLANVISHRTVYQITDSLEMDSVGYINSFAVSSMKIVNDTLFGTGSPDNNRDRNPGMAIVDLTNLRQPRRISYLWQSLRGGIRASSRFFDLRDGKMFTCDGVNGTTIYDVSSVEHPATVGYYDNRGDFHNVALSPDYIYTSNWLNWQVNRINSFRLRVYSRRPISDPEEVYAYESSPQDSVFGYGYSEFSRPIVIGDRLYGLANGGYFAGFSLEDPARPTPLFIVNQNQFGAGQHFVVDGTIAYTVSTYIYAIDFSDYRNPRLLSRIYCYQAQGGIACDERYLYVHSWSDGLYIYSRANNRLSQVGLLRLGPTVAANDILLYANRAYIILSHYALIVDISDPPNPVVTGELRWPGLTWRASISDGVLFASCWELGVYAYSLEDPDNPRRVGYYDTPGRSHQALAQDGYLYVADSDEIGIYDVGEITGWWAPVLSDTAHDFGEVELDSSAQWQFTLTNNAQHPMQLFSASVDDSSFAAILDSVVLESGERSSISVRFRPRSAEEYTGTLTIHTDRRRLTVALTGRGTPLSAPQDQTLPTAFALHPPYPNPFNGVVTIRYDLPEESPVRIAVYDLVGREVARLVEGRQPAGRHSAVWKGADAASGVYTIQLEASGQKVIRKALLLK